MENLVMATTNDGPLDYSLYNLFKYLISKKLIILAVPFVITLLTALWTLSISNTYLSESILSPTEEASGGGLNNLSGQLGGLASLAGISLGGDSTDQVTIAIEIIRSRSFIASFVKNNGIKPELMAGTDWSADSDVILFDESIYNTSTQKWVRAPKAGKPSEPTDLEVYEQFLQILNVERDAATGLVRISLEYFSPGHAKQWLSALIEQINHDMRRREIEATRQNIEYLEGKVAQIGDIEMKSVFYQLIQEQTKQLMLAEVRSEFVFTVIDPPFIPELKHAPRRAIICLVAAFLSGFIIVAWFVFKYLVSPRR